jgi:hypothetical protein
MAHKFLDYDGNAVKSAEKAHTIMAVFESTGKYGYPGDDPTGVTWHYFVGSEESAAKYVRTERGYVFYGLGIYNKIWDGYYTDQAGLYDHDLVRFETLVEVDIESLELLRHEYGSRDYLFTGSINLTFTPGWSAELSCTDGDVVTGSLKYNGVVVQPLEFTVEELIIMAEENMPSLDF